MKTNRTKQRVDESNEELRTLIKQIRDFLTRRSLTSCLSRPAPVFVIIHKHGSAEQHKTVLVPSRGRGRPGECRVGG